MLPISMDSVQQFLDDTLGFSFEWEDISALKLHATLFTFFAILYFSRRVFVQNVEESPVSFSVTVPREAKPGWKGVVDDEPKIKVSH